MIEKSSAIDVFVPMDRRVALGQGKRLAERARGAVLFADVSGFTALTIVLNERFGPERGAEELTRQMNRVFEVLIARVHHYGGSVIIFSGDAITCWFEEDNGRRATACALSMQTEMKQFERVTAVGAIEFSLALKVAVMAGKANRFLVGHSHIQRLEALAGAILDRMGSAEQLLKQGETIVGAEVLAWFGDQLRVAEWRSDGRGEFFAVVERTTAEIDPAPWPQVSLDPQLGREWVMRPVAERVLRGEGEYLAQLRPSVALFLRFGGIEYDEDREAGAKLDVYIRWVQTVLAEYEGHLLELTIGDKGSYLYCVFGTPLIHENDPARAISAAIDLQSPPTGMAYIGPVQIGISQGMMRAGAYGSRNRRSYGVQGREVSIAARLMSKAKPGQILVSSRIVKATDTLFEFKSLGVVTLKGVQDPMPIFKVLGEKAQKEAIDSASIAPLVGRERETAVLVEQLQELENGWGGTIILEGETGIGKSRLVTEFLREAAHRDFLTLVGTGNEMTQSTAYHACRSIFLQLFEIGTDDDIERAWSKVIAWVGKDEGDELLQKLPLLSVVLPFHISDSEFTYHLSGELRANNTTEVLVAVLKKAAERTPLVLVLEDSHWLDSSTWTLVERLKWESLSILLVISTGPIRGIGVSEETAEQYEQLLAAPDSRLLSLKPLSLEETSRLVCQRLGIIALPENVGELIHARAEGHPFFSEELAIALRDTGLIQIENGNCRLTTGLDELYNLGFPNTVQKVITGRIDRLPPAQQLTLKVSSVVGRVFSYRTVYDIYPVETDRPQLDNYLEHLENQAIVQPLVEERSRGETAVRNGDQQYVFRNGMIQDVAYYSLLFEQRQQLHKAIGEWYERAYTADLANHYHILAHHWQKSDVPVRAVPYLANAGQQALKNGAYNEAVNLISQLIEIVKDQPDEWQAVTSGLSKETQLAIWHRQLGDSYSKLFDMARTIENARIALTMLGSPEPETVGGMWRSFIKGVAIQAAHRVWPGWYLGKQQNDIVLLERGLVFQLMMEAYLFEDDFLKSYNAGMHSLNYLEEAALETDELARTLSNYIVGLSALPRQIFVSQYQRLARKSILETSSLEAKATFQYRLGIYYFGIGRWDAGEAAHQEAIDIYRQIGHTRPMVESLTHLGNFRFFRGDYRGLDELGQEVYRLASREGSNQLMAWGLNLMGMDRMKTAESHQQALHYFESAAELVNGQFQGVTLHLYQGWLSILYLNLGHYEKARKTADKIMNTMGQGPVFFALKVHAYTAPAQVYLTLWEQTGRDKSLRKMARTACRALGRYARAFVIGRPRSYLYWGNYHWLSGRKWLGRYYWRRSLAKAQALGMQYEEGLAYFELGRHLKAENKERERLLERAVENFERLGATWDVESVRNAQRKNGE